MAFQMLSFLGHLLALILSKELSLLVDGHPKILVAEGGHGGSFLNFLSKLVARKGRGHFTVSQPSPDSHTFDVFPR